MTNIFSYLKDHEQHIFQTVETLVKAESPSHDKALVDECGQVLQDLFKEHLGLTAEVFKQESAGNHLKFTYGDGDEQILIIVHFDTVWDKGRLSLRIDGNRAYGPGIFDMKSGILLSLWAVKAIKELNILMVV
ncbi:hypothetical protein GCM10010965_32610 [Caldalkalibacillus thermarum]|uniref:M20/M25/M40 family metallo-hydrolase n=1 Tax=Caldalkalibacillus thermarum TaxID=296745 RepID=UPI00166D336B|nr:M20/M25/M40 family metallo-hydrolase [Caldalkalibacillus thermarum]GGK37264.1 hypothetical protein GCM10010965_32610 [Caldalkalibacillus thermarum]